jgi:hypothetical protein
VNEIQSGERAGTGTRFLSKILPSGSRSSVRTRSIHFAGVAESSKPVRTALRKSRNRPNAFDPFSGSCGAGRTGSDDPAGVAKLSELVWTVFRKSQNGPNWFDPFSGSRGDVRTGLDDLPGVAKLSELVWTILREANFQKFFFWWGGVAAPPKFFPHKADCKFSPHTNGTFRPTDTNYSLILVKPRGGTGVSRVRTVAIFHVIAPARLGCYPSHRPAIRRLCISPKHSWIWCNSLKATPPVKTEIWAAQQRRPTLREISLAVLLNCEPSTKRK